MLHDDSVKLTRYALEHYEEFRITQPDEFKKLQKYEGEYDFIRNTTKRFLGSNAAPFYFDNFYRDKDLLETGLEFFANGLLVMPYDDCFMVFHVEEEDGGYTNYAFWFTKVEDKIGICPFIQVKNQDGYIPGLFALLDPKDVFGLQAFCMFVGPNFTREELQTAVKEAINFFICGCMLLSLPHYDKVYTEASEKINKKRLKMGKPPLRGYTRIQLKKEIAERMRNPSGCGWVVKPHWRRGHIRTLKTGMKVPVRPCMVNWEGDKELDKNIYIVSGGTNE